MHKLIANEVFKIFAQKKIYVFMIMIVLFSLLPAIEMALGSIDFTLNAQNLPLYMLATINSIIPIFLIVTLGDSITDEYVTGTLKLPLLHGASRTRLLTAKILALIVPVTVLLFLGMMATYLIGALLFGWGDQFIYNGNVFATETGILSTMGSYATSILPLMAFAAVIMLICLQFPGSGAAVATSIGLLLLLSLAGQLVENIRPYLIITYFHEFPNSLFFGGNGREITLSLIVMFVYGVFSYLGSIYLFKKKDLLY